MKVAVLGTGMVGKAHAARLIELGHDVAMGTRDVVGTRHSNQPDHLGQSFNAWHQEHDAVRLMGLADAAGFGDIAINALLGEASTTTLGGLATRLAGKVVIDLSNGMDFATGELYVCNTDSLGEQIQRALPDSQVVKTLNTTYAPVQVDPTTLANGEHTAFLSGNEPSAKAAVTALLTEYGWRHIVDLGGIETARGAEMYMPLYFAFAKANGGNLVMNINVVG
jgi:predicted dinucleotide-binding enzyme